MSSVKLPPQPFDLRGCRFIIGNHREDFFEALDIIKPYVVIEVSSTHAIIKPIAEVLSVDDIKKMTLKLADLGYRVDANAIYKTYWDGAFRRIELEPIVINWDIKMNNIGRHEIDVMKAQSIIASLCADIDLTKQICQINHKKFGVDTKISWVLPTDADKTKLAINQLLSVNGYNETYMVNRELKTVGDAFRFISMISIYVLWVNGRGTEFEGMQKCSLGHLVNGAGLGFSCAEPMA